MDQAIIELLEQGYQLQQQGQFRQAKAHYLTVLESDKENVFALNLLGVIHYKEGDYEASVSYLTNALAHDNQDPDTYSNLGLAYKELKQMPKAQQMFEQSLALNPNQPVVLNNLGNIFASINEHDKAIYCFDSALRIDGRYLDCLLNIFVSLKALNQFDKAAFAVKQALLVAPEDSRSHNIEGELYKQQIQYEQAKQCFEKAIAIDGNIVAKINLASVLKLLGTELEAKALLTQVLELEPENAEANNHLGVLYEQLGDFENAAKYFRLALKYDPAHASAYYQLSKLKNQRLTDDEINKIESLIAQATTLDILKSSLYLALAWEYEKQKDFDKSMEYFVKGKGIKAKQFPFDKNAMEHYLAFCQQMFPINKQSTDKLQKNANDLQPIFIVGMPRSGTTLTEQILASHSQVYGAGEVGYINELAHLAEQLTQQKYPMCISSLFDGQISQLRENYLAKIRERSGDARYFVDKNPLNYHSVGFINLVFPEAKFVYCKRDPMDNCVSIFKLPFDDNQTYSHDLEALGLYYRQHEALMDFWQQCFPEAIFNNQYEETVADIETQARSLLSFIGLDFEQSVLSFYDNKRIVLTPSAEQVRQPIYNSSVNAWQKYQQHLGPLIKALS